MKLFGNKKASIPVVIFVVGVLVICVLALGIFMIRENGDKKSFEYGLTSMQEIDFMLEDLKVAYVLNGASGLGDELRKAQGQYPKYTIRSNDNEIKISRIITNYELSFLARIPVIGESEKPGIIIERKVKISDIAGK